MAELGFELSLALIPLFLTTLCKGWLELHLRQSALKEVERCHCQVKRGWTFGTCDVYHN